MVFIDTARPNRCAPNGFVPNQAGLQLIADDSVASADALTKAQDYFLTLTESVTGVDAATRASEVNLSEEVQMTDWVRVSGPSSNTDFVG